MSEPSPEANQAAVWAGYPQTYATLYRAYCEGYDTATAEAREDVFNAVFPKGTENGNESWEQILKAIHDTNADLSEAMKQLRESDVEIAKLRKELEYWKEQVPMPTKTTDDYLANAHQPLDSARDKQPSAITTNEQAYRDGTLSQPSPPTAEEAHEKIQSAMEAARHMPEYEQEGRELEGSKCGCDETSCGFHKAQDALEVSAPTADVEKFKQEAEHTYGKNTFAAQVYEAGCHYGAAIASAPLVAALEWYRDEARAVAKHKDGNTEALLASFHVLALDNGKRADAALQNEK